MMKRQSTGFGAALSTLALFLAAACGTSASPQFQAPGSVAQCDGTDLAHYEEVTLSQTRSLSRVWRAHTPSPRAGIVFVSGVDGGFVEPADAIYHRLAEKLSHQGVASVFVSYRAPGVLEPSVDDALEAAAFLREQGVTRLALVGWSFGGAVITHVGAQLAPEVTTIVGFAPQALDTEPIARFRDHQSVFLIHSRDDENVPFISSQQILDEAPPQIEQRLEALDGYDHLLTGTGELLEPLVLEWLKLKLGL